MLEDFAARLTATPFHSLVLYLLGNVPGFPPIVQTVHILGVSAVMGSIVLIDLNVLGLALPSQPTTELVRRLMPWTWWALPSQLVSGLIFFLARPQSYVVNPIFKAKFTMLAPALVLAFVFHRTTLRDPQFWTSRRIPARIMAVVSLVLWIGVVMAGRWIAYADYLFPVE
jgi:hypothetical protein